MATKPTLAVWKFASCDGCQLSLLDCEDELLQLTELVEIAYFLEASSRVAEGPYDVSLVEGSVTTVEDAERIRHVREQSGVVVTIGACATSGGIQALRNMLDTDSLVAQVYAHPEYIRTLATSTPISAHVKVDYELRGCPINKKQLVEVLLALLSQRRPNVKSHSVCLECKQRGTTCILVAGRTPCLGPITHAGCGALCPAYGRGCYGCYGPSQDAQGSKLVETLRRAGATELELSRLLATFNVADPGLAEAQQLVTLGRRASNGTTSGAPTGTRTPSSTTDRNEP